MAEIVDAQCVWLIGGTQESAELASQLVQSGLPLMVTVTTEVARSLYPLLNPAQIWVGRLTPETVTDFIHTYRIGKILDASHPFAVEISQLAIEVATHLKRPYLRFERRTLPSATSDNLIYLNSLGTLLSGDYLTHQRVLLALGYRFLTQFQPWQSRATLFARILPSLTALEAALVAGFSSDRLIALRPPIALELERAIWQHWQISMVVTKASGTAGGEAIKRQLAQELNVTLIVIDRPAIAYPLQTSDIEQALEFCQSQEL